MPHPFLYVFWLMLKCRESQLSPFLFTRPWLLLPSSRLLCSFPPQLPALSIPPLHRLPFPKERRNTKSVGLLHCLSFSLTYCWVNLLEPLTKFLHGSDKDLVARARDIVSNSIMAEISKEDPQGHNEYKDAVRHHIVATFQRLRLYLLVLDHLMEIYNSSV